MISELDAHQAHLTILKEELSEVHRTLPFDEIKWNVLIEDAFFTNEKIKELISLKDL